MKKMQGAAIAGNSYLGVAHALIGELDTAFQYFDKAMAGHEGFMLFVKGYFKGVPEFLEDSRAKALFKSLGILYG